MINNIHNIYCDESSVENKTQFFVIGAIIISRDQKQTLLSQYKNLIAKHKFTELKWSRISRASFPVYTQVIDLFIKNNDASYYAIVVDKTKMDQKTYHNNDSELAFYKFYYLLLKEKLNSNSKYYLYLDKKPVSVKNRVGVLKNFLKGFISSSRTNCIIKHVQEYSSKENLLIQIADIFTGAIASKFNHTAKNKEKRELTTYLEKMIGRSLTKNCSLSERKFNIFVWEPRR